MYCRGHSERGAGLHCGSITPPLAVTLRHEQSVPLQLHCLPGAGAVPRVSCVKQKNQVGICMYLLYIRGSSASCWLLAARPIVLVLGHHSRCLSQVVVCWACRDLVSPAQTAAHLPNSSAPRARARTTVIPEHAAAGCQPVLVPGTLAVLAMLGFSLAAPAPLAVALPFISALDISACLVRSLNAWLHQQRSAYSGIPSC